jgi:hypothetical protein
VRLQGDSLLQLALADDSGKCPKITSDGYVADYVSPYEWSVTGGMETTLTIVVLTLVVQQTCSSWVWR